MRARVAWCVVLAVALPAAANAPTDPAGRASNDGSDALPASRLSVLRDRRWIEWWRSERAPSAWDAADARLAGALTWRTVTKGVAWGEGRLAGTGEAWRLRLIVVRLDPSLVRLSLDTAFTEGRTRPAWSVERAADDAVVAVNTGQFPRTLPWGWVTINGREFLPPGKGPLSMAMAIDPEGHVAWISGDSLGQADRRGYVTAFQSYPTLLVNGVVPGPLRAARRGIDVEHRDARLAIGQLRDGSVVIAMTRFDAAGDALDFVPLGLTTPEMAAVMGALGATNAVMLDGGISSQMIIRDPAGERRWDGLRKVPLGLIVRSR